MKNSNEIYDVAIIGGGASGLFLAARLSNALKVAILECNDRVGKKLLATGNGKCNLTNLNMSSAKYNAPDFVKGVLCDFDEKDLMRTLEEMGLTLRVVEDRVYPFSESASTVLDVLRRAAKNSGTEIFTSHTVTKITNLTPASQNSPDGGKKPYGMFLVEGEEFQMKARTVVLATGSDAGFGKSSYSLFEGLGHTVAPPVPSLAPIIVEKSQIKGLGGVRVKAGLEIDGVIEHGELLFKEIGLSGVLAFNMSRLIARGSSSKIARIDFMPEASEEELTERFEKFEGSVEDALLGMFHSRVQERVMSLAKANREDSAKKHAKDLARAIKRYEVQITGIADKSLAQVMSGGLSREEFDERLMSKLCSGAYAIGEALDVDGESGGYNLQWAFSSAHIVAMRLNEALV